ncbi:thyroid hormone-inducible hepatic protein [Gouania willdenowi]|uniref:Mid1-interacting protein 1A-like n=1 Tax=Gouania willdenowi TaxID=441366 RepID=A0A8C5E9U5_GOUWI|nr:mid1-interacting protein 1A-like [Gouania willdenowi]
MQLSPETHFYRSGLYLAMRKYSTAVRDMEQTVLLPTLLRDIRSDQVWNSQSEDISTDLYDYYMMLKALRNTVESGSINKDDLKTQSKTTELLLDSDPQALLHFHLRGLFSVMSDLTEKTQSVKDKYVEVIGVSKGRGNQDFKLHV